MDQQSLDSDLKKGQGKIEAFSTRASKAIAARFAGVFAIGAVTNVAKRVVDFGSKIHDLAQRLQISTDEAQAFNYAAEQSGTSIENIESALAQLARTQRDAIEGNLRMRDSFQLLGVSMDTLNKGTRIDVLREIEKTVRSGELSMKQLAAASDVLGESARMLFPLMKAGLAELASEAEKLGIIISPENIELLKEFSKEILRLGFRLTAFAAQLAPTLNLLNRFIDIIDASFEIGGAPWRFIGAASAGGQDISRITAGDIREKFDKAIGSTPSSIPAPKTQSNEISPDELNRAYLSFLRQRMDEQINELREINRNTRDGVFK